MKRNGKLLCMLFLIALVGAALLVCGSLLRSRLYVLMYHDLAPDSEEETPWRITQSHFRSDLQWLADNGYQTVLPSELAEGGDLPDKPVLITFDDGYESNYTLGFPLLQEFHAKAVISLVVQHVGQDPDVLTWDQCRQMQASGLVEFGSHTYLLHDETIARLENETRGEYQARVFPDLQQSVDCIERELETKVLYFSYPLGVTDAWAEAYLSEHFAVTAVSDPGVDHVGHSLHRLKRCGVGKGVSVRDYLPPCGTKGDQTA